MPASHSPTLSRMAPRRLLQLTGMLLLLCALPFLVAFVWHGDDAVRLHPVLALLAPNTALAIVCAGIALCLQQASVWRRRLGGLLVLLSLPVMMQHLSGWYPQQPLLQLLLAGCDCGPLPAAEPMSLLTASGLLAAGVLLALPQTISAGISIALACLVWAAGAVGGGSRLLGSSELLLVGEHSRGMGWLTAVLLILLGSGLCLAGWRSRSWRQYLHERVDRQLAAVGMALLLLLCIGAGLIGMSAVLRQDDSAGKAMLDNALAYNTALLDNAIDERIKLHQLAAGLPDIEAAYAGVEYCDRGDPAVPSIRLVRGKAELYWNDGIFLRSWHERPGTGKVIMCSDMSAVLLSSQRLAWQLGATQETLICGRAGERIGCLPTRFRNSWFWLPPQAGGDELPVIRALKGKSGASISGDYRGRRVLAAYRPSRWQLGVVQKIDTAEYYSPLRRQVWIALSVILLLTLLGGRLLFLFAHPLVAALQHLRRSTQALVDHAPIAIVGLDAHMMVQSANPIASELFGLGAADAAEYPHLQRLVAEAERPKVAALLQQAVDGGCVCSQVKAQAADGHLFDAELHLCAYVFDGATYLIALFADISSRIRHESESLWWKQLFQHAHWGVAIDRGPGAGLQLVNPWFASMHGSRPEELQGRSLESLALPAGLEDVLARLRHADEQGYCSYETEHRRSDGTTFPVRVDVAVVRPAGQQAGYRIVNLIDIHERRQMEQALAERERLIRTVIDSQREMIVRWLPDGTLVFVNQALCRFLGRSKPQLIGRSWFDQGGRLDPAPMQVLAHARSSAAAPVRQEREMLDAAGNRRLVAWTDQPILDRNGALECIQSMGLDITEERRVERALRDSELRLGAIFHSLYQFTAVLSTSGVLLDVNDNSLAFVDGLRDAEIGRYFWETSWWRNNGTAQSGLQRAVQEAALGRLVRYELEMRGAGDKRALLECSLKPVLGGDGKVATLIFEGRDITQPRRESDTIAAQHRQLRALSASLPGMLFQLVYNPQTQAAMFAYVSQGAEALLGLSCEQLQGGSTRIETLVHEDDSAAFGESLRHAAGLFEMWRWNGRLVDRSLGLHHWVSLRATPHLGAGGEVIFDGLVLNIGELKQQESEVEKSREMLRELAAHLDSVREEERKRIAREVHDELGQTLTALRMEIAMLEMATETSDRPTHARSLSMKSLVDQAIGVVRNVASSLRPVALDMGLVPALLWLANEFQQRTGIVCSVEVFSKQIELDDERATVLFRIVQESLTNILRHAEARHVWITLGKIGSRYVLEVRDDGKGFDTRAAARANAFGLLGMRERATMLGGSAEVISEIGAGTVVKVEVAEK